MKTNSSAKKTNNNSRSKIIHISNTVHKKLKIFCANFGVALGPTAEKALTDYINKNS